jgi:lantibiotic modifying enzyme
LSEVEGALRVLRRNVREDTAFDLASGAAGCAAVMVRLARERPESPALAIADQAGAHLLRNARRLGDTLVWPPAEGQEPLLGFSHGAAGIAWALAHLGLATGEQRYSEAARQALTYERERFDAETQNWPDLRVREGAADKRSFSWSWCHGAPGIGIARLSSPGAAGDATARAEVEAALASTLRTGFGGSHCLCHGELGNAELFLWAARVWQEPHWRDEALCRAGAALQTAEQEGGWRSGAPGYVEVPGLMDGLAGIGYGLLRMAEPEVVPSVLALEGPAGHDA